MKENHESSVFIIDLERRVIRYVAVTRHPTAKWTAQQIVNAYPWDEAPRFLMRDRDSIFGKYFQQRVKGMGIEEVISAPKSPWQNPYAERFVGSVRREAIDHMVILNESHLRKVLAQYKDYYNNDRTHLSLDKDAPNGRTKQTFQPDGEVIALPRIGGLHHRYEWRESEAA